jgi:hypothetical protein
MKGPFDGRDAIYIFGDPREYQGHWTVGAKTLDGAIKRFRVGGLFPYKYVHKEFRITKKRKNYSDEIVGAKPGATIPVYVKVSRGEEEQLVYELPYEITQLDTKGLYALPTNLLEGENSTALQTTEADSGLERRDVEDKLQTIQQKLNEIETLRRDLEQQKRALQKDVDEKMKQIWIIELYLGSEEEIIQLSSGAPADETEPITVFQQILCMDEELAFYYFTKGKIQNFDFKTIKEFDDWLLKDPHHLDQVLPAKKGIVGLRPRRNPKKYEVTDLASAWAAMNKNQQNKKTYILIRNGENLYRIWADTELWPRFFPLRSEFDVKEKEHVWPSDEEKKKEKIEEYLRGLIVIQGLLDRSTVFKPLPSTEISVMKPEDVEKYFVLVRNDEPALSDGSELLGWEEYKKWLHEQVEVGSRVLLTTTCTQDKYLQYHVDYPYYTRSHTSDFSPKVGDLFVIDREEQHSGPNAHFETKWSFLYLPRDDIYTGWDEDTSTSYRQRRKRIRWRCYATEVIAFDAISPKYVEYLLNNRHERTKYENYFDMLMYWAQKKREEEEKELPFVELILSQCGLNPRDAKNTEEILRVKRLVRWWKLKTKYTRTLQNDEAKALRMIKSAFLKGKDFEDDPEYKLDKLRKAHETN